MLTRCVLCLGTPSRCFRSPWNSARVLPRISPYGPLNSKFVLMAEISLEEKLEIDLKKSNEERKQKSEADISQTFELDS